MTSRQKIAKLRVCASCEWLFTLVTNEEGCPKCGFAHYGARFVYGPKAYRYAVTQQPWADRKMREYAFKLSAEIQESNRSRSASSTGLFIKKQTFL